MFGVGFKFCVLCFWFEVFGPSVRARRHSPPNQNGTPKTHEPRTENLKPKTDGVTTSGFKTPPTIPRRAARAHGKRAKNRRSEDPKGIRDHAAAGGTARRAVKRGMISKRKHGRTRVCVHVRIFPSLERRPMAADPPACHFSVLSRLTAASAATRFARQGVRESQIQAAFGS